MKIPELPDSSTPLTDLYQRHRGGEAEATERLFFYFAERLSRLAQRYLSPRLAARVDGEEVMQSALKSFLMRASAGNFRIENSHDMWKLLVTITVRKAREQVRHHTAERRDIQREAAQPLLGEAAIVDQLTEEPSLAEAVACAEELDRLVKDDPPEYARVLELRLADYSIREIAEDLNLTKGTVESILNVFKNRLERRWNELSRNNAAH